MEHVLQSRMHQASPAALCMQRHPSPAVPSQPRSHLAWLQLSAAAPQVRQLVETLRCCAHQAFPITPDVRRAYDSAEPFDLHGIVLRGTLLRLIQHRVGFFSPEVSGEIPSVRAHIPSTQAVRGPRQLPAAAPHCCA